MTTNLFKRIMLLVLIIYLSAVGAASILDGDKGSVAIVSNCRYNCTTIGQEYLRAVKGSPFKPPICLCIDKDMKQTELWGENICDEANKIINNSVFYCWDRMERGLEVNNGKKKIKQKNQYI